MADQSCLPWTAVIKTPRSSIAPGPPNDSLLFSTNVKNREKVPKKIAQKLLQVDRAVERRVETTEMDVAEKMQSVGDPLERWNPMRDDYVSSSFNSYDQGPGKFLKKSSDGYSLFVDNIPVSLTQEGLKNLFSDCGKVLRTHIIKQMSPSRVTTYGFVKYGTIREANSAIQKYNGFEMGRNIRLSVAFSNDSSKIEKDGAHYLPNGGDNAEKDLLSSHYNDHEVLSQGDSLTGNTNNNNSDYQLGSVSQAISTAAVSIKNFEAEDSQPKCTLCQAPSRKFCSVCRAPYCSPECQKNDWKKHKAECKVAVQPSSSEDKLVNSTISESQLEIRKPEVLKVANESSITSTEPAAVDAVFANGNVCKESGKASPVTFSDSSDLSHEKEEVSIPVSHSLSSKKPVHLLSYDDLLGVFARLPSDYSFPTWEESLPSQFHAFPLYVRSGIKLSILPLLADCKGRLEGLLEFQQCDLPSFSKLSPQEITSHDVYGYYDNGFFCRVSAFQSLQQFLHYDTGDVVGKLSPSQLFILPKKISSIPSLRYRAAMAGLVENNPEDGAATLKALVDSKILSLKNVELVNHSKGFPVIIADFYSFDGSTSYGDVMIGRGHVKKYKKEDCHSPETQQLAKSWGLVLAPICTFNSVAKVPAWYDRFSLSKETFSIFPTAVVSPDVIWAQVFHESMSKFKTFMEELNEVYIPTSNASYVPTVGEVCVARYTDRLFYRAEIISVNPSGVIKVMFLDYGNTVNVSYRDLRHIRASFLTVPRQAVRFSLAHITAIGSAWSEEASQLVKNIMLEKMISVNIVSREGSVFQVNAYSAASPSLHIGDILVNKGLAVKEGDLPHVMKGVAQARKPITIGRGSAFNCATGFQPSRDRSSPSQPSVCSRVSRDSDDILQNRPFKNHDSKQPNTDAELDNNSQKSGIWKPKESNNQKASGSPRQGNDSAKEFGKFKKGSNSKQASFGGSKQRRSNKPDGFGSIFGKSKQPSVADVASKAGTPIVVGSPTNSNIPLELNVVLQFLDLPNVAVSASVTHVNSLSSFFVVLDATRSKFNTMNSDMQSRRYAPLRSPLCDSYCIARHSCTSMFSRAKIISFVSKQKVNVQFLDYGSIEEVDVSQLRVFDPLYKSLPIQAIHCSLSGIPELPDTAMEMFKSLVEKGVTVTKLSTKNGLNEVTLFSDACEGDLATYLISMHDAQPTHSITIVEDEQEDSSIARTGGQSLSTISHSKCPADSSNSTKMSFNEMQASPSINAPNSCESTTSSFKYSSLKQLSIPSECTAVFLAYAVSPDELYVHIAVEPHISQMETLTTDQFQDILPLSNPQVGDVCAARFSLDNCWYRAHIIKMKSGNDCFVHFIDFGNYETISTNDMKTCPVSLHDIPVLAVKCSINGIVPANGEVWDSACVSFIADHYSGKMLQCQSVSAGVELCDIAGNKLSEVLVTHGYAKRAPIQLPTSPLTSSLSSSEIQPHVSSVEQMPDHLSSVKASYSLPAQAIRPDSHSVNVTYSLPSINDQPVSSESGKALVSLASDNTPVRSPIENVIVPDISLAHIFGSLSPVEVIISEINSLSCVWVQEASIENATMLSDLHTSVQAYASTQKPLVSSPQTGQFCCAFYSVDNCWYRAKVLNVLEDEVCILHIDFGSSDRVHFRHLLPIAKHLAISPPCSFCVALSGDFCDSAEVLSHLNKFVNAKVFMNVADSTCDPSSVEFLDISSGKSLTEQFVCSMPPCLESSPSPSPPPAGRSFSQSASSALTHTAPLVGVTPLTKSSKVYMADDLQSVLLASVDQLDILIMHVESLHEVYVLPSANMQRLVHLSEEIEAWFSTAPLLQSSPVVGQLCLANSDVHGVFRAEVMLCDDQMSTCVVKSVDFGSVEVLKCCELRQVNEAIASHKKLTFKCAVFGSVRNVGSHAKKILEDNFMGNVVVSCLIYSRVPLLVDFSGGKCTRSLRETLVQFLCLPLVQKHISVPAASVAVGNTVPVLVTVIESPHYFWLQVADGKSAEDSENLSAQLQVYCEKAPLLCEPVLLGQFVVARFEEDGLWYRAQVIEVADIMPVVRFVDFGNIQKTCVSLMRPLVNTFVSLPAQAILCTTEGFSKDKTAAFKDLTANSLFRCIFKERVDIDKMLVDLFDLESGQNLATLLSNH